MADPRQAASQVLPLRPGRSAVVTLPCKGTQVLLTAEQIDTCLAVSVTCQRCGDTWTLIPMTAETLAGIGSHTTLPPDHVAVMIVEGEL